MPNGSGNDGRYTYAWEGPAAGAPSQIAVIWWGAMPEEPDLMVIYNEGWEPFTVTNLSGWSQGDWRWCGDLGRSWGGFRDCDPGGTSHAGIRPWRRRQDRARGGLVPRAVREMRHDACPAAGDRIELEGV